MFWRSIFFEVLPNYDENKVYVSDIKKIIQWYNLLIDKGFLEDEDTENSSEENKEKQ